MKLFEIYFNNGELGGDNETWSELTVAKDLDGARVKAWYKFRETFDTTKNPNAEFHVEQIEKIEGYEIIVVKRRKKE